MSNINKHPKLIFLGVILAAFVINLDLTVANLALAPIGRGFHATLTSLQWIINIYMLCCVVFQLLAGRLGDILGSKKVYLFGITFFVLGVNRAITTPGTASLVLKYIQKNQHGLAMGAFYTTAFFAGICGVALTGFIVGIFSFHHLILQLAPFHIHLTAQHWFVLKNIANGGFSVVKLSTLFAPGLVAKALPLVRSSFIYGLSAAMWIMVGLYVISLVLTGFVREGKNHAKN